MWTRGHGSDMSKNIAGYEGIGLELARPHFRARMEADMLLIAGGQKQSSAVISEWMAIMKEVYQKCYDSREALHTKLGQVFSSFDASRWQVIVEIQNPNFAPCSILHPGHIPRFAESNPYDDEALHTNDTESRMLFGGRAEGKGESVQVRPVPADDGSSKGSGSAPGWGWWRIWWWRRGRARRWGQAR